MKKLTALLLALIMTLALVACGGDSNKKDNDPPAEPLALQGCLRFTF